MYKEKVLEYYKLVDSKEFDKLLGLFSKNIVYIRAGHEIKGISKLKDFYFNIRKLRGKHKLEIIEVKNKAVFVKGVFNGKNSKNKVNLRFTDVFYFNKEKLIEKRETYIDKGYLESI